MRVPGLSYNQSMLTGNKSRVAAGHSLSSAHMSEHSKFSMRTVETYAHTC